MRWIVLGTVLSLAFAPARAAAQEPSSSRFRLEPYVGAYNDSYDISPDGENTAVRIGVRLGYDLGDRARVLADAAYARTANVSNPQGLESYFVYDNVWALTTLGAEYDVIAGPTSAALGLRAGAGWRRNDLSGKIGDPPAYADWYSGGGFSPIDVVVPSLTLRRNVARGAGVFLSLEDHIFDVLEGPTDHSPSLSIGLSLR